MNAPNASQEAPPAFVFSSPEGFALCRPILEEYLPYDPYDFQIEGICKAFDRVDLLAILATGTGKTGFSHYVYDLKKPFPLSLCQISG
jgi:hypothetical protein